MTKGVLHQMQQKEKLTELNEKTHGLVAKTVELQLTAEELSAKLELKEQELQQLKESLRKKEEVIEEMTIKNAELLSQLKAFKEAAYTVE